MRAARIRNNPKEEQALLDEARALAASAAAKEKAANAEAAGRDLPEGQHATGRGRGSARGQGNRCDFTY